MMEYGEGLTPCVEVERWRRRFWLSAAVNAGLAALIAWMCR